MLLCINLTFWPFPMYFQIFALQNKKQTNKKNPLILSLVCLSIQASHKSSENINQVFFVSWYLNLHLDLSGATIKPE